MKKSKDKVIRFEHWVDDKYLYLIDIVVREGAFECWVQRADVPIAGYRLTRFTSETDYKGFLSYVEENLEWLIHQYEFADVDEEDSLYWQSNSESFDESSHTSSEDEEDEHLWEHLCHEMELENRELLGDYPYSEVLY